MSNNTASEVDKAFKARWDQAGVDEKAAPVYSDHEVLGLCWAWFSRGWAAKEAADLGELDALRQEAERLQRSVSLYVTEAVESEDKIAALEAELEAEYG